MLVVAAVSWGSGPDRKEKTMTNDELQRDAAAELSWDPRVDSHEIAVSALDRRRGELGVNGNRAAVPDVGR